MTENSGSKPRARLMTVLFLALIMIPLVGSMAAEAAQSSAASLVALSTTTLSFVGTQGQTHLNRTLTFVGIINQTVDVTLVPTDLYDNSTGKTISANDVRITPFTFSTLNNQTNVNISINTSEAKSGTYGGTILVTAAIYNSTTRNLQTAAIQVNVSALIQPGIFLFAEPQVVIIVFIIILELIAYLYPDEWPGETYIVVLFGFIITLSWASILLVYGLSPINNILTAIGTIAIIPFLGWVINDLNSKRTAQNDKEKSARAIENEGNKSDIDMIRNVLGELETHYASFKPFPEEDDESKKISSTDTKLWKILYDESYVLSRKVWDTSCKQGAMFDLPVLELGQYYNFVDIYNRYYSCAIELTKDKDTKTKYIQPGTKVFLEAFEVFRSAYAELETVVYIHLSYYLGLILKTNLSPLPVEFPRVTRILLKKCIDYGVLNASKYPGNFKYPEFQDFPKYVRDRTLIEKYSLRKQLQASEGSINQIENELKTGVKPDDFANEAKKRIDVWDMSAAGLEDVFNEIYNRNKIPAFYKKVRDDFARKINELEQIVESLPDPLQGVPRKGKRIFHEKDRDN